MRLKLYKSNLDNNDGSGGLELVIEGVRGDPSETNPGTSVFIEYYEGKVMCHVWTDGHTDCTTTELT